MTNTRLTHATPAGLYAHAAYRGWECDASAPAGGVQDIARQLVESDPGRGVDVLLGGGLASFRRVEEV